MQTERQIIPMRDGVRLETFVYRPEGDGAFPALLVRCMYGTSGPEGRAEVGMLPKRDSSIGPMVFVFQG